MVVIDASLVVMLLVAETLSNQARNLLRSWRVADINLAAPDFMASEVVSAFRKKIYEGALTANDAKELITRFYRLNIDFRPSRPLHERAIDLAVELNQRLAYDCHYLALAEFQNCDFWAADQPFYRAARGSHSRVKWVGNYNP